MKPNGKPDRRIHRTLIPALHILPHNFSRAYLTFLPLALFEILAVYLTAIYQLAQSRIWTMFLLTRFWQRGAATTLALDYPMPDPIPDPIPDPEPASPSLDEPDPGVFHHTPRGHRPNNRNQPPNPPTG